MGADGFEGDAAHHVAGEGADHDLAGVLQSDAAGTEIKNRLLVHLADGGAVGAFDVVGEDFELGFGVNDGVVGEEEVAVGLFGVGFLGVLADKDFAVEDAVGAPGEDAVVEFVAFATGVGVIHHGVVIGQLVAPDQVEAVENAGAVFTVEKGLNLVAGQVRAGGDGMGSPMAARALLGMHGGEVDGALVLFLNFAVVHAGFRAENQFGDGVSEMGRVGEADVGFQNLHSLRSPATIKLRTWAAAPGSSAVAMKSKCTGWAMTLPGAAQMRAPSWKNAVFKAVKTAASLACNAREMRLQFRGAAGQRGPEAAGLKCRRPARTRRKVPGKNGRPRKPGGRPPGRK